MMAHTTGYILRRALTHISHIDEHRELILRFTFIANLTNIIISLQEELKEKNVNRYEDNVKDESSFVIDLLLHISQIQ